MLTVDAAIRCKKCAPSSYSYVPGLGGNGVFDSDRFKGDACVELMNRVNVNDLILQWEA